MIGRQQTGRATMMKFVGRSRSRGRSALGRGRRRIHDDAMSKIKFHFQIHSSHSFQGFIGNIQLVGFHFLRRRRSGAENRDLVRVEEGQRTCLPLFLSANQLNRIYKGFNSSVRIRNSTSNTTVANLLLLHLCPVHHRTTIHHITSSVGCLNFFADESGSNKEV